MNKADAARLNGKKGGRPRKSGDSAPTPKRRTVKKPTAPPVVAANNPPPADNPPATIENPFGLSPRELLFVEAYCGKANFNATQAYRLAGYVAVGHSRTVNASHVLTKPNVRQAVAAKFAERAHALRVVSGDEALENLSLHARGDIGNILGPNDPISLLPADVRRTIKAVRETPYGRNIELYDAQRANELLAKAAGKLKDVHIVATSLEDILASANALQQERAGA